MSELFANLGKLIRFLGPKWLTRDKDVGPAKVETDSRVLYTMALYYDATVDRIERGIKQRFPGGGAAADALPYIGRDRNIIRGPAQSRASWELQLIRAWDDWQLAGIAWSLLEQRRAFLSPFAMRLATVDVHAKWSIIGADGARSVEKATAWNWDTLNSRWWRFWTVIDMTGFEPWEPSPPWGDPDLWGGAWGTPGYTWGSTATPDDIAGLRRIVRTWKPEGTFCEFIVIVFDNTSGAFEPDATAPPAPDGDWHLWMNRDTGAIYVDG